MTIDNHPLTPKPADDRGTGFGFAQADIACVNEVALEYFLGDINAAALIVARHREQAERGLVEALLRAASRFEIAAEGAKERAPVFRKWAAEVRKALDTRP